jgi:hypothetical protein
MTGSCEPIKVSRRISVPAEHIFNILASPMRHSELDGSGMLRGAMSSEPIAGLGDTFYMKMYMDEVGDYVMVNYVVEYELNRRIGWEPAPGDAAASEDGLYPIGVPSGQRWSYELVPDGGDATMVTEIFDCANASEDLRVAIQNGEVWIDSMTATLVKLDQICQH